MDLRWEWRRFDELSAGTLYDLLVLRQEVFVVEQRCAYLDADGFDRVAHHLLGADTAGRLVASLRVLPAGTRFAGPSIGRVVVDSRARGRGLGWTLMVEGIRRARELYPGAPLHLSAQDTLVGFYERLGFTPAGPPHDEDGIPHRNMVLGARGTSG